MNLIHAHLNRVIRERGTHALHITGPGHGAPFALAGSPRRVRATRRRPPADHRSETGPTGPPPGSNGPVRATPATSSVRSTGRQAIGLERRSRP
ncbi:hypothetical protein [Embleya sp. NBC_00896]|uniref:hypothetical protein n=1 Tax=Embleya sp. NBC_00896 TaxID=2975961 RepID=UPI0038644C68